MIELLPAVALLSALRRSLSLCCTRHFADACQCAAAATQLREKKVMDALVALQERELEGSMSRDH